MRIRNIDLTIREEKAAKDGDIRELSNSELAELSGGAAAFMRGEIVGSTVGLTDLTTSTGGGQAASFPTHISNARFTQSATTLCNWSGCTYYISGC